MKAAAAVMAILMLAASPAATAPAAMLENLRDLKEACARRETDKLASNLCLAYITGHIDAAVIIRSIQNLPPLCFNERNFAVLLDRIVADLPATDNEGAAALYVQSSIAKLMACPK